MSWKSQQHSFNKVSISKTSSYVRIENVNIDKHILKEGRRVSKIMMSFAAKVGFGKKTCDKIMSLIPQFEN